MTSDKIFRLLATAVVVSLILSLSFTTTAIADDAVPPATEEPVQSPTEEPSATEEPVQSPTEEPVATVEPPAEEPLVTLSELAEQLPQETDVVVIVNEQVEPLATQVAANVFVAGDPIWCEDNVAPDPGDSRCSASYPNLGLLIDDIDTIAPAKDGTIWIMGNDNSSSAIVIDDTTFAGWSGFSLTLQGGWDGNYGSTTTLSNSVFFVPITIENWSAPVTVNKITVNGQFYTPGSIGLDIKTSDIVSLNDVSLNNNGDFGLSVEADGDIDAYNLTASDNSSGVELTSLGSVTLLGVNSFVGNQGVGLVVEASGDIDLENITASGNGGTGADLLTNFGDVMLSGANVFDGNGSSGLVIDSAGDIDIDTISLSASGNTGGSGLDLSSQNSVSLLGAANVFNNNATQGLFIDSGSDIDLENITASDNADGADLNLSGSLTMSGINAFNNNDGFGLFVDAGGDIEAENITANQNGLASGGNGAELYASGDFFLSGSNVFIGNGGAGLYVDVRGEIDAENVNASNNGASGAEFITLRSFSLTGANVFNGNALDGLFVDAAGPVAIENIIASFNGGSGVFIEGNGNASITCGLIGNNAGYEIEADLPGSLTLSGVDFGDDIDANLGVDEDNLILVSNDCFRYPKVDDENDEDGLLTFIPPVPPLPVHVVNADDGQVIRTECDAYRGTQLNTLWGGVYIPCPISDSARLLSIPSSALPGELPTGATLVSSLHFAITKDGVAYQPLETPGSIWYVDASVNIKNFGTEVMHWNGQDWVDITNQVNPFFSVFFPIPQEIMDKELAILYWDGTAWVELSDGQFLGDGRVVQAGGFVENGFFRAIVNFTGTFALVER